MFEFMFQIITMLNAQGKSAACLFLSYGTSPLLLHYLLPPSQHPPDLTPSAVYPRQLQQAAMLLTHVIHTLHISPDNIILTGDSAGANLGLALLSHLSHPHPSTTLSIPPITLSAPLRGIALLSPSVSFDVSAPSFRANECRDCVTARAVKQWSAAFLGCAWPHTGRTDGYSEPAEAEVGWWSGVRVREVLIVAGGGEALKDGIVEFEERFTRGVGEGVGVEFHVVGGEYHDQPNVDLVLGYGEADECGQAKIVKSWIASRF